MPAAVIVAAECPLEVCNRGTSNDPSRSGCTRMPDVAVVHAQPLHLSCVENIWPTTLWSSTGVRCSIAWKGLREATRLSLQRTVGDSSATWPTLRCCCSPMSLSGPCRGRVSCSSKTRICWRRSSNCCACAEFWPPASSASTLELASTVSCRKVPRVWPEDHVLIRTVVATDLLRYVVRWTAHMHALDVVATLRLLRACDKTVVQSSNPPHQSNSSTSRSVSKFAYANRWCLITHEA